MRSNKDEFWHEVFYYTDEFQSIVESYTGGSIDTCEEEDKLEITIKYGDK